MSSKRELASILEIKIKDESRYIQEMGEDQNPQVKEILIRAKERKDVYEGILNYLKTGSKGLI